MDRKEYLRQYYLMRKELGDSYVPWKYVKSDVEYMYGANTSEQEAQRQRKRKEKYALEGPELKTKEQVVRHTALERLRREQNPDSYKRASIKSRAKKKTILDSVKTSYGCLNPDCRSGGDLSSYCLDYHHVDRSDKSVCVSQANSQQAMIVEMRKCTVLCAICHRKETWGELDASGFKKCNVDENGAVID